MRCAFVGVVPDEARNERVVAELERIPSAGDSVEIDGGTLTVQRMDGRRIDRIRFTPSPDETPTDEVVIASRVTSAVGGGES